MTSPGIVVIGAGIAGLTAAYRLQKTGLDVKVLESKPYVGGRMITVEWQDFLVDPGAKFVTTSDRYLMDMVDELGLRDQLIRDQEGLPIIIYRDGKIHAANFLSIGSYLRWSGVSLRARLAMLKLIPRFIRMSGLKNVYHLEQAPGTDGDTLEEFFYQKISPEMFEYWAIPMFETMCSYTGTDISSKAFLAMMAGYMNADTVSFKSGIGTLPEALAKTLNLQTSSHAEKITLQPDNSGAKITYRQGGAIKTIQALRVILAIPGNRVLRLFSEPRPAWQDFFPEVCYTQSAMQYHIAETDFDPGIPGTFIPRAEKLPINSIGFEKYQNGRWLLLTDPSVYVFDLKDREQELIERAVSVAVQIFPELQGKFTAHRIFKWPEKVPAFRPGYLDALLKFWHNPQENPVYFCGDYFAGPSTGGALYSGKEAAERVMDSLE